MNASHEYPESIKEAATTLDKVKPDWAKAIDLDSLDLSDCNHCILGQCFGYYDDGLDALFGIDLTSLQFDNTHFLGDGIFGHSADAKEWLSEIKLRSQGQLNAQVS